MLRSRIPVMVILFLAGSVLYAQDRDTLLYMEAQPEAGYQFPFFLFIPAGTSQLTENTLLVEPNNTGFVNDTFAVHVEAARRQVLSGPLGHFIAREMQMPLLVPVFPRPEKDWKIYTHLLDRDVMKVKKGSLHRIDLQLLAMINAAREKLFELNYVTTQKVMMAGFSSAGVFCNRFAVLHPVWVKGYAAGGVNGLLMMPVAELEGVPLPYPLGIADYEKITGQEYDVRQFQELYHYAFMGEEDTNDAVHYDDGYSKKERKIIFNVFGEEMVPARWNKCKDLYRQLTENEWLKTYPHTGHEINDYIRRDLLSYFRRTLKKK